MPTKEDIMEVLKECYDPEIPVNIVDLGLIYDISFKSQKVFIKMTLTALGCPLSESIMEEMKQKISLIKGVKDVEIEVVFDPPWSPEKMSKDAKQVLGL